jgi:type IV pilus assembly protein PilC
LSSLISAGIGLMPALVHLKTHASNRTERAMLVEILAGLDHQLTFAEAIRRLPRGIPDFDVALVEAGETSGRLDASCRLLAEYYRERARLGRQVLTDLTYPLAVFHLAIFIFPFSDLFITGNIGVYLGKTVGVLLPIYAIVFAGLLALQGRHSESWRARMEKVLNRIPVLGSARQNLALARLAAALEALLSAGIPILAAWPLAASASGSPALKKIVADWGPALASGKTTPAQAVLDAPMFRGIFAAQYATGETSGKLDDTLRRLHTYLHEEGVRKLRFFSQWVPKLVYLGAMLWIAYKVVRFYLGYFEQLAPLL